MHPSLIGPYLYLINLSLLHTLSKPCAFELITSAFYPHKPILYSSPFHHGHRLPNRRDIPSELHFTIWYLFFVSPRCH